MLIYGLDRYVRYGEVVDVNLPRDKETGKTKGFGFVMYEDQRSTILAVDNLNGANVLDRTLRVDHVKKYKQARVKGEDGEWKEQEEQSLNAKPEMIGESAALPRPWPAYTLYSADDVASESSASSAPNIDPDDPMRDYLLEKWREERAKKKGKKSKRKHKDETPEERRARKERRREKRARRGANNNAGLKGVEALLRSLPK
jgi:RNA-binding motif protein, X-linked 2